MADERFAENSELLRMAQSGDESATQKLMETNAGLVRSIAMRFTGRGV